jgi:hypothetical protein
MTRISIFIVSAAVLLAGADCAAQQPTPSAPAAQTAPPAASTQEDPLPSPDQLWDINMLSCENWLDASDDDRAATGMFYYGWLAGNRGIHTLRPAAIQPNLHKVLEFCAQHRKSTIVKAFQSALNPNKRD